MLLGHYATALAAKKVAPTVSLGTLCLAAQFVDLLFPFFLLLDLEHFRIDPGNTQVMPLDFYDYSLSHSLLTGIGWAILLGGIFFLFRRQIKNALIVGGLVVGHWILDFISHRADLPLAPGCKLYLGLGLWNSLFWSIVVEMGLFLGGLFLYLRVTAAKDRIGLYGFWGLISIWILIQVGSYGGEPPPNDTAFALAGLGQWLFILWAYWINRHRKSVS